METLIGKLKAKLQLLELTHEKTESIISTGITEKIRRHKEALQSIVTGMEEIKREVEQAKLEGGEALDKVKEWGKEFELKIDAADTEITLLEERVKRMVADAENEEREKKETLLARQHEDQLKFERQQLEQKAEFAKEKVASPSTQNVKLPKLVITKYNGALENWLTFWNKFEAEIDKTGLPAVTKFAYLKELVEPRVRKGIDDLLHQKATSVRKIFFKQITVRQARLLMRMWKTSKDSLPFPEHIPRRFTISLRHSCTMFSRSKPWEKRRIARHWFEES